MLVTLFMLMYYNSTIGWQPIETYDTRKNCDEVRLYIGKEGPASSSSYMCIPVQRRAEAPAKDQSVAPKGDAK